MSIGVSGPSATAGGANWWQVLAGRKDGTPVVVVGREFPVLAAAQRRQCVKVSKSAIRNRRRERAAHQDQ
jgi:hypothetical protein